MTVSTLNTYVLELGFHIVNLCVLGTIRNGPLRGVPFRTNSSLTYSRPVVQQRSQIVVDARTVPLSIYARSRHAYRSPGFCPSRLLRVTCFSGPNY